MLENVKNEIKIKTFVDEKQQENVRKSFFTINREMLPYKLHFFLFIGAMGAVLPYIPVLAKNNLGLSATSLAAVYTTHQFIFIFSKPAIGYLADYFNKLKAIIIALTVIQGVVLFLLLAIPRIDHVEEISKNDTENNLKQQFCKVCNIHRTQNLLSEKQFEQVMCNRFFSNETFGIKTVLCFPEDDMFLEVSNDYIISNFLCEVPSQQNLNLLDQQLNSTDTFYFNIAVFSIEKYPNSTMCTEINEYSLPLKQTSILSKSGCYKVKIRNISDTVEDLLSETSNFFCNASHNKETEAAKLPSINMMHTYQFWLFAVIVIMAGICNNSLFTMADTACYESLQKTGSDYGRQRLWGAVSWGVIAPFAGFMNDATNSYITAWCLMGVFCALEIWNISKVDLVKPHFSQNILKDIGIVMQSKEFMLFTFGVFMNGVATGIIWFYLSWFLSNIGGNRLLIGLAHTIQCFVGELPFMFYSGWMIKKLGHFNIVTLAIFMHCLRFFWYSYFRNPWMMLPIESVHGFTYGSFYAAITSYAKLNAKPGTEATTQSVLCTCYEGFGAGLGCVLAGIGFDAYGGFNTFFYASMCCAFASVINFASSVYLKRKGKNIDFTPPVVTVK